MKLAEITFSLNNYDLAATLTSGQAFRWSPREDGWEGVIGSRWIFAREIPGRLQLRGLAPVSEWRWASEYFQTNARLEEILATFPEDAPMQAAVSACQGLRLLKQDPWECLASFILSSTKQIVQIRQIVHALCDRHGEMVQSPGAAVCKAFPAAERIASLSESDLRLCKMGFRAPYLLETARLIASGKLDLEGIRTMPTRTARETLCELPGVGEKIANCVLLFAYGFQDAFPVDVWVRKAIAQLYFPKRTPSPKRLQNFVETHFGPNAGYAQQYLFHYMRTKMVSRVRAR